MKRKIWFALGLLTVIVLITAATAPDRLVSELPFGTNITAYDYIIMNTGNPPKTVRVSLSNALNGMIVLSNFPAVGGGGGGDDKIATNRGIGFFNTFRGSTNFANEFTATQTVNLIRGATNLLSHGNLTVTNNADIRLYAWENAGAVTAAEGAAGVLTGEYGYVATFYNNFGESGGSSPASYLAVSAKQITVSGIPTGPPGTIGRKIYRTTAAGEGTDFQLLTNIANNTTTSFTDNTADASLTSTIGLASLGGSLFVEDVPILRYFSQNVFLGASAGSNHVSGTGNLFAGDLAGRSSRTNINNVILGFESARSPSIMAGNVAILGAMSESLGVMQFNNAIGQDALDYATNATGNNVMGRDALFKATNAQLNTVIGDFALEDIWGLTNVIGLGARITAGPNYLHDSAAIGNYVELTADNQLVVGGTNSGGGFSEGYFGQGYTNISPGGFLLGSTGGAGTNNSGGPLKLRPGLSTGNLNGAPLHILGGIAGASGTTLNAARTNLTVSSTNIVINTNLLSGPGVVATIDANGLLGRTNAAGVQTNDLTKIDGINGTYSGLSGTNSTNTGTFVQLPVTLHASGIFIGSDISQQTNKTSGTLTWAASNIVKHAVNKLIVDGTSGDGSLRVTNVSHPELAAADTNGLTIYFFWWDGARTNFIVDTQPVTFAGGTNVVITSPSQFVRNINASGAAQTNDLTKQPAATVLTNLSTDREIFRLHTGDARNEDYQMGTALGLKRKLPESETLTLATGENTVHALFFVSRFTTNGVLTNYLFATTETAPAKLLRFDPDNLTNYSVVTFVADGFHDQASDAIYSPTTDLIYVVFGHTNRVTVTSVHPDTLQTNDVISNTSLGSTIPSVGTGQSIASDGAALYILTLNAPSVVLKYSLAYALLGQTNIWTNGHCLRFDGTNLYASGAILDPSWVARIGTNLSVTLQAMPAGLGQFTDDFALAGDHLYLGQEDASGIVVRVMKKDLSVIDQIDTGVAAVNYALAFDGRYVWSLSQSTPGTMVRIDPVTLEIHKFGGMTNSPNEFASDGSRIFLSHFAAPSKITRFVVPPVAQEYSLANLSGQRLIVIGTNGTFSAPNIPGSGTNLTWSATGITRTTGGGGGTSARIMVSYVGTNAPIDASLGNYFAIILTNANTGVYITNGVDGQEINVEFFQDSAGFRSVNLIPQTLGSPTNYIAKGSDITYAPTFPTTTNAFKMDLAKFRYHTGIEGIAWTTNRWSIIGGLKGYPNFD